MAFKFITFCALLAAASAGFVSSPVTYAAAPVVKYVNPAVDAVATTQHNVVRSYDGTVSQYSKYVHTPYSSVHKEDTRINNNVYTPAIAKTVTYAAPAVAKTVVAPTYYTHAASAVTKTVHSHESPVVYSHPHAVTKTVYSHESPVVYSHPSVAKTVSYAAPAVTKTLSYAAPAPVYTNTLVSPVPKVHTYADPAPIVYSHGAPVVNQAIAYSPAATVAHVTFDVFGTHWGY